MWGAGGGGGTDSGPPDLGTVGLLWFESWDDGHWFFGLAPKGLRINSPGKRDGASGLESACLASWPGRFFFFL